MITSGQSMQCIHRWLIVAKQPLVDICNTPLEVVLVVNGLQASRNEYGNTPAMTATNPDCKEALSAVTLGGESARLKMAEEIEAAAAEAEAARLEQYMQKEEV